MYVHTCVCGVFCLKYLPFINTLTTVFLSLFGHVISLMGATKWMGPCVDNLQFLFYLNVFKVPIAVSWRGGKYVLKRKSITTKCYMPLRFLSFHLLRMFNELALPLANEFASTKTTYNIRWGRGIKMLQKMSKISSSYYHFHFIAIPFIVGHLSRP